MLRYGGRFSTSSIIIVSLMLITPKRLRLLFFAVLILLTLSTFSSAQQTCLATQFQCSAQLGNQYGRCISQQWRCDGEPDCPNGDDEAGCHHPRQDELPGIFSTSSESSESSKQDEPGNNSNANNSTACLTGNCTGQNSNGNGSGGAEQQLDDALVLCQAGDFQCATGDRKCFPAEYRCDHDLDCADGSDESGCWDDSADDLLSNVTYCSPVDSVDSNSTPSCDGIPTLRCNSSPNEEAVAAAAISPAMMNSSVVILRTLRGSDTGSNSNGSCTCEPGFIGINVDPATGLVWNASLASPGSLPQHVCVDEDECAIIGDLCSQKCINSFGSYKCTCAEGFHLSPDGHTCKAYGGSMVIVFSNGTDIFISNGQATSAVVTKLSNANDLAMEHSRNLIYWSDSSTKKIQRSAVIRPAPGALRDDVVVDDIVAPNGLTVDWIRRLLFWVDGGRQLIEVADMSSPNVLRRAIVWEDVERPRDIVCHPRLGYLFWAEWGNNNHRPRIERIAMDGSDPHIIAHKQVYRPCGLVVDFATDRLFWVDAEKLTLESSDLEGRHRMLIIPEAPQGSTRLFHPMAVALFEDFAYVSDQTERAVYRIRRHPLPRNDGNQVSWQQFTHSHTYSKLGSLLVFHNATQPTFQITPCSATGLNCTQLCLPRGATEYTCACSTGYSLQSDNRTCLPPEPSVGYLYLQFERRLSRISLAGPDFVDRTFFSLAGDDDSRITAFDVDLMSSTFLFAKRYSADQMLSLYASSLPDGPGGAASKNNGTTSAPRHVLTLGTDHSATGHFEVAVDWITGNIYLLLADTGRIDVVSPLSAGANNSRRAVVAWTSISKGAHDLVLHPPEGLMFWLDISASSSTGTLSELGAQSPTAESYYIVRSGLDGSRLGKFLEIGPVSTVMSTRPSLVASGNRLFWTSDKNHVISSVKIDGTDRQIHLESTSKQPNLMAVPFAGGVSKLFFYDSTESALFSTSLNRNFSTLRIRPTLDHLNGMTIPTLSSTMTPLPMNSCRQTACEHLCLLSPDVIGYRCACAIGYTLRQDGTSCARNFDNLLLVAHGQGDLLQIDLTTPYSASLPLPLNPTPQNVVAVAADPTQNVVCWADNGRKMVACSGPGLDTSASGSEVVATELDSVESIAYDYLNKNLYMADTVRPQIAVVHVPSGQLRLLLMRVTISQPHSLALSLASGHVFWSEWNAAGTTVRGARIGRVDMDGANAITIVDGALGWPQGITVDSVRQRVYWGDRHFGRIESCDFEGERRSVFLISVNPYGLVAVGSTLYWTDPESRTIRSANIPTSLTTQIKPGQQQPTTPNSGTTAMSKVPGESLPAMKTIVSDTKNLFGVSTLSKLVPEQQLTACDITCAGLCLRHPNGHRCHCPTGFQPTPTAASCQPVANQIVLIVGESAVSLVFLGDLANDENSQKQISAKFPAVVLRHPTEQQIVDADLHWNSANNPLYYAVTTPTSSIIYRTHLSVGYKQERLLSVANATVLSLAVDTVNSNVYWFETRWSTTLTYLRVFSMPRLLTKTLLTNGFEQPKDLTVHPSRGRLFWINLAGPAAIETSLGDGTERRMLVSRDAGSPASLALDSGNNLLYWTDTLTTSLHVCDLAGRMLQTISSGVARQAAVLAVSPTHIFWASGKGKAVYYAPTKSAAETPASQLRLTEMHQGVRGIGIYNQPASIPVDANSNGNSLCADNCPYICLRRGETHLVCTCPDSDLLATPGASSCSGDEVMNTSATDPATRTGFDAQTPSSPTSDSNSLSQSLIALIGVALLFVFVIIVVVLVVCRQRLRRNSPQHRHRTRSDSMMSVIFCDLCWWSPSSRHDRGRSTSPHATLTSTVSGNFGGVDDEAGVALMTVTGEKSQLGGPQMDYQGGDASAESPSASNGHKRQQQPGSRQCSTVVSLRFDNTGTDGDNITVKRVETVL